MGNEWSGKLQPHAGSSLIYLLPLSGNAGGFYFMYFKYIVTNVDDDVDVAKSNIVGRDLFIHFEQIYSKWVQKGTSYLKFWL